ncbi:NAD-dependent dehydratase [Mucilaginibacter pallidiroseus]|uniref:NAD-dependent dehydratase n=1 Tax=Mucilaginibacter pallidiroseus TaxID=2599295 RepID=A0A563UDG1_9SPHI|nr:NmrA family NAD(P)-binding protein [Mucilaginibacter pallidiroseus]TWR29323.1 NAD-dependent dehydratase [Mucilaginibacter pallidiroseus]
MKILVTGSLGHISKPLATTLVAANHNVTVISSSEDKVAAIEAIGATPAIGSVTDIKFLTEAFTGANALYIMIPNDITSPDYRKYIAGIGSNYAEAIKASGVKKVVLLSSIGAHIDGGTGPISGIHDVEQIFATLDGVDIKMLRPAFFYTNFLGNIDMVKHQGFLGGNYGPESNIVMTHPNDIAEIAAFELQQNFTGKTIRYIASDERTLADVAAVLGAAIGKPDLKWVEFTNEQSLDGLLQAGLPNEFARSYTEMGTAIKKQILWADYLQHKPATLGQTKLEDFAKEFAAAYNK